MSWQQKQLDSCWKTVMHVQIYVLQAFWIWKEDLQSFYFNTYSMLIIIMLWDLLFFSWNSFLWVFWGSGVSSNRKLLLFLPALCIRGVHSWRVLDELWTLKDFNIQENAATSSAQQRKYMQLQTNDRIEWKKWR